MKKRVLLRNRRGSTLLECVVGLLLFTVVVTMGTAMFSTASLMSAHTTDLGNAVNNAVDKAETGVEPGTASEITITFPTAGDDVKCRVNCIPTTDAEGKVTLWRFAPATT